MWEWPDSLDALVAASDFHRLVLETDDVRVLETTIGPGRWVPLHTHRWPSVLYVLAAGDVVRRDHEGTILTDSRVTVRLPPARPPSWRRCLPTPSRTSATRRSTCSTWR